MGGGFWTQVRERLDARLRSGRGGLRSRADKQQALRRRGERLLRQMLGPGTRFRAGQWEAVEAVVARGERLLVVHRTGWGKSIVYFLVTRLLRERGAGPTLLISPLLS